MHFVMSNRRAGKFRQAEKVAAREAVAEATLIAPATTHIIADHDPADETARRTVVLEGSVAEMQALDARTTEDVIVEPLILHQIEKSVLGAFAFSDVHHINSSFPTGTGQTVTIDVRGDGAGLKEATVFLIMRAQNGSIEVIESQSDEQGRAVFDLSLLFEPLQVVAVPYQGYWPMRAAISGANTTVICPALPANQRIDWWHRATGFDRYDEAAGNGIRVGVIDTGFGPHCHLSGTDEGAFIDNAFDANGGADVDRHGSHVCGTIAGTPGAALRHCGVAPGIELFSVRVFPADAGASNVDIANAIDFLSRERDCDVINMSLGAPFPSEIIRDAMQDALERGTLCVCAAANSGGPVEWPAAFSEAAAVSAAGRLGEAPVGSISAEKEPRVPSEFGLDRMFIATFSCRGPEIDCIAPGVGIIATVPERHGFDRPYAALDGTSMASPVAAGTLARALAEDAAYLAMPRDLHRASMARFKLQNICRSIGLAAVHQGMGMPLE